MKLIAAISLAVLASTAQAGQLIGYNDYPEDDAPQVRTVRPDSGARTYRIERDEDDYQSRPRQSQARTRQQLPLDVISALPTQVQQDVIDNFSWELLARKLSVYARYMKNELKASEYELNQINRSRQDR